MAAPNLLNSIPSSINAVIEQMSYAVWYANQMASYPAAVVSTGYPALNEALPNRGWPRSALIELLLQQQGIGECNCCVQHCQLSCDCSALL